MTNPASSSSRRVILLSLAIHLGLILYAHHVDTHPERFGGLRYTDVDWRVVTDGARLIFRPERRDEIAQGWLTQRMRWGIGDPYRRATFRYTPLLPLVLSPSLLHQLIGKTVLSLLSLSVPLVLLADNDCQFWPVHLLWTLNPFVLNITTRGSPEAIIVLLVVAFLGCLKRAARRGPPITDEKSEAVHGGSLWEALAAGLFAMAVSWKIYPIIYVPAIWTYLSRQNGWFGLPVWRFGVITLATLVLVNGALWSIWGQPFLDHTFLYHLTRLDHRHNFSPYFYPIYLSLFASARSVSGSSSYSVVQEILRHPLISFIPQFGLCAMIGFTLTPISLDLSVFASTAVFVIFNKVCTSQYFTWWIPLLIPLIPQLRIPPSKASIMVSLWVASQALWLGTAYQLEFNAAAVHLQLWAAGIGLLGVSTWVVGEVVGAWEGETDRLRGEDQEGKERPEADVLRGTKRRKVQ